MKLVNTSNTISAPSPDSAALPVPPVPKGKSPKDTSTTSPQQEPIEKPKDTDYLIFSFTITYILLLTTGIITFIEAMRTKTPYIRHILNLETCISLIAGYFYGLFISQINKYKEQGKPIDWADITRTRYIDWSITTPMMLLALCLVLSSNINKSVHAVSFISIVVLNYTMLLLGFLGEINYMSRVYSDIIGFIVFFVMFGLIFYWFVYPKFSRPNYILFFIYLAVWTMYGIVYMFNEVTKNTLTNILDLTAKCLIGLGLWVYYTKIIRA